MKLYLIEYGTDGPDNTAYVLLNRVEDLKIITQANNFFIWKSQLLATLNRSLPCPLFDLTEITGNNPD